MQAKLGPDHSDTLACMVSLANCYTAFGRGAEAVSLLHKTVELARPRVEKDPENSLLRSFLACTHGQIGDAQQAQFDYAGAVESYAKSIELFETLDYAGILRDRLPLDRFKLYKQRLALCRKAEQAVRDLDFALRQPAKEAPQLLDLRVRYLLNKQKLPAAVESAVKIKELAGGRPDGTYKAACAYALCAAVTTPVAGAPSSDQLADEAMALLKQAVANGYKEAAHMKQDKDLDLLRERDDFKKLLAHLDSNK
jgi:tetratricopeptide (TPR) repeat protein